jgi:alkylhydroperoxidase family enzyme
VDAIRKDWRTAPIDERDRLMLGYVDTLTRDATKVTREDLERLREAGFDDTAILQVNLIASWFNYINRVADGLGVGRE